MFNVNPLFFYFTDICAMSDEIIWDSPIGIESNPKRSIPIQPFIDTEEGKASRVSSWIIPLLFSHIAFFVIVIDGAIVSLFQFSFSSAFFTPSPCYLDDHMNFPPSRPTHSLIHNCYPQQAGKIVFSEELPDRFSGSGIRLFKFRLLWWLHDHSPLIDVDIEMVNLLASRFPPPVLQFEQNYIRGSLANQITF
jgi:hypothetical protein